MGSQRVRHGWATFTFTLTILCFLLSVLVFLIFIMLFLFSPLTWAKFIKHFLLCVVGIYLIKFYIFISLLTFLCPFSSVQSLSHVWLFVTLWTTAHQAPLSMEFSRQEYWRELPSTSPGNFSGSAVHWALCQSGGRSPVMSTATLRIWRKPLFPQKSTPVVVHL